MERPLPGGAAEVRAGEPGALQADPVEAQLLEKAQRGNAFAFEEMVRRYQRQVYATAVRIVRRHEVADDLAQDAFLRAYQALGSFDTGRPFGPWIRRIVANLAINHVRSPRAREDALPENHELRPAPGEGPLGAVLEGEAQAVLERALGELPNEQRTVFVLRVFEELSYREIAESLGIPEGTVMSRLARARDRLRELVGPYLGPVTRRAGSVP